MLRGLYTAWTGMVNEQKRLDVVSNNMAIRCLELKYEMDLRRITIRQSGI